MLNKDKIYASFLLVPFKKIKHQKSIFAFFGKKVFKEQFACYGILYIFFSFLYLILMVYIFLLL